MKLKIGRHTYDITKDDRFIDNGACVQLLTQGRDFDGRGGIKTPVLSKAAVKKISTHDFILMKKIPGMNAKVFTLSI